MMTFRSPWAQALLILGLMLAALLCFLPAPTSLDVLSRLLKARDVEGLRRVMLASPPVSLGAIKTGGAYDTGRYGWSAEETEGFSADKFVVFSTPITSQDIGEFLFRRTGDKLQYIPETETNGVRILRHSLNVSFEPKLKRATITDSVRLSASGEKRGVFAFRMSPCYRVKALSDQDGRPVSFRQVSGIILVPKPMVPAVTYKIEYAGIANLPLYAGSISEKEATLTNDYWYPMIGRQPAPYDLAVETPPGWVPAAQGDLVSHEGNLWRYRMDLPVSYYSLSAGPYRRVEQKFGRLTLGMMSPRVSEDRMRLQPELYAPIIQFYEKSFGTWPFNRYTALDSPAYGGGALESYSGATYGGGLPEEDPHEPSHTFWGGVIVNTYLKSFWNESFAVFTQGLYARNVPIGNQQERERAFVSDSEPDASYNEVSCAEGGAFAGPVAGSLGYGKGAKVLQMLEQILGTEKLVAAMREWVATQPKGTPGEWEDFEKVCLRLYPGDKLNPFFRDWLHKPGYAKLNVRNVEFANRELSLQVAFDGPAFDMPLELMLVNRQGVQSFRAIRVDKPGTYRISLSEKPALVSVDPWRKALRVKKADEEPTSVERFVSTAKRYSDPAHPEYLANLRAGGTLSAVPTDLAGTLIVGHPDTLPMLEDLCAKAGFVVKADTLSYGGTTIDLKQGAALALVDLGGGKRCAIGLGKTELRPNTGNALLALTDRLGRFLRGKTEPKVSGNLTFRL